MQKLKNFIWQSWLWNCSTYRFLIFFRPQRMLRVPRDRQWKLKLPNRFPSTSYLITQTTDITSPSIPAIWGACSHSCCEYLRFLIDVGLGRCCSKIVTPPWQNRNTHTQNISHWPWKALPSGPNSVEEQDIWSQQWLAHLTNWLTLSPHFSPW